MKSTSKLLEVLENNISNEELEYSKYLLESIDARERELLKYKRAFEILKDKFEIKLSAEYPDSDYNDMPISGDMEYTLNDEIQLTYEEYELLEELMNNDNKYGTDI